MASLYVIDVPEFAVLQDCLATPGVRVHQVGDYLKFEAAGAPLVLRRESSKVRDAIWFAALTGGFTGRIAHFDGTELRLDGD
jgi:hypothetical protein